jgi:RHS repeat-associated protein
VVDAAGNLQRTPSAAMTYNSGDELTSSADASGATGYTYDRNGARVSAVPASGPISTYSYDGARELLGAGDVLYGYTPDGLLATRTGTGTRESFLWSNAGSRPTAVEENNLFYVYGPDDLPLEQITPSTGSVLFYHHDDLGSTRVLTDAGGNLAATYSYDPFGRLSGQTGTSYNPFLFTGAYTDPQNGLVDMTSRMYDPRTASFLTPDPLALTTLSPYAYVHDDPLNRIDPEGLSDAGSSGASNGVQVTQQRNPINSEIDINGLVPMRGQLAFITNHPTTIAPKPAGSKWSLMNDTNWQLQVPVCDLVKAYVQTGPTLGGAQLGATIGTDSFPVQGQVQVGPDGSGQAEIDVKWGGSDNQANQAGVNVTHDAGSGTTTVTGTLKIMF